MAIRRSENEALDAVEQRLVMPIDRYLQILHVHNAVMVQIEHEAFRHRVSGTNKCKSK